MSEWVSERQRKLEYFEMKNTTEKKHTHTQNFYQPKMLSTFRINTYLFMFRVWLSIYIMVVALSSLPCERLQRMHAVGFLFLIFLPQFLLLFALACLHLSLLLNLHISTSALLSSVSRFRFRSIDMKSWQGPYEIELGNIILCTV